MYKEVAGKLPVLNVRYYKPTNKDGRPFMPVEFAVAAYRFAHSIIRPFYVINGSGIVDIFGPEEASTSTAGGRSLQPGHRVEEHPARSGQPTPRPPRKIDTQLSVPLTSLPGSAVPPPDPTKDLAVRNTIRGNASVIVQAAGREGDARSRCPTPRSGLAMIRAGRARHRCGSTF